MKINKKTILAGLVLFALLTALAVWWRTIEKPTLVDLQKRYLFARTEAEREGVVDQLEQYYINLPVPDSISRNVDKAVQAALDTTKIDPANLTLDQTEANVYVLEGQLTAALKTAMIARARRDDLAFEEIMNRLRETAKIVDEGLQSDYWSNFIARMAQFNREEAVSSLKAERAEKLCHFDNTGGRFLIAEKYGALSLKYLQQAEDTRLRLTLIQRFQIILNHYYGLNDLSIALANRYLAKAHRIRYHLRALGLAFNEGGSLQDNGEIAQALEIFQRIISSAEQYQAVPNISWYKINALILAATAYWQLGMYKETLAYCQKAEQLELSSIEKTELHAIRGLVQRRLGNYQEAETEYRLALRLTQSDTVNLIRILGNIGLMYYELTEYDQALEYCQRALDILQRFSPKHYERKSNLLIDIAKIMAKKGRYFTVDSLLREAAKLIEKAADLPRRHADLLFTTGRFSSDINKNQQALIYIQKADSICEKHGLVRLGLDIKLDYARILAQLGQFSNARQQLEEVLRTAQQLDEKEKAIDASAMSAKIEAQQGRSDNAARISEIVIQDIEELSSRFDSPERLAAYRQKIYDYLKEAVIYEISNKRFVSAFQKLDHAKAATLKMRNHISDSANGEPSSSSHAVALNDLQNHLDERSLVIDFLLMPDTLYAFVLNRGGLQLFRKELSIENLKSTVYAYRDSINNTIAVFRDGYNAHAIDAHFEGTTQLGRKLYQDLFGWPELNACLQGSNSVYIIPDEFLYDVPFATLVLDQPDSTVFLIEKVALMNLPSASLLQGHDANDLAFGVEYKELMVSADTRIPEAREFVTEIKHQFPLAEVLQTDREVIEKNHVLTAMNQSHGIYIFSGHSVANVVDPDLSFIEIYVAKAASQTAQTIQMQWADLKSLDWSKAELVLLLGCQTAAGKLYRGSGISGLQQGFLSMGAKRVVASLWRIDAAQSLPQAQSFLQSWVRLGYPAWAMREMQLQSIRRLRQHSYFRKPHPYFWGSYILTVKTI